MTKGYVFDIKRYALHDGPGIRTTVFLKGCPLRCLWCHNPEGQNPGQEIMLRPGRCLEGCSRCLEVCPLTAISKIGSWPKIDSSKCDCCGLCTQVCPSEALEIIGREMTPEEVMVEVMKDFAFYQQSGGGVTFSGGEPLQQPKFLEKLLRLAKKNHLHTVVDTSGYAQFDLFVRLLPFVDLFLYDLKLIDPERHLKYTGKRNELILENLQKLVKLTDKIIIRIPIIPSVNDDKENLNLMIKFISSLGQVGGVELLPYHTLGKDKYGRLGRNYQLLDIKKPSSEEMNRIAAYFKENNLSVLIGG
ncbi:MAG: glycyl-radical enzyme activating protein [Candidatus Aminicenantes bacterium]|nr:glycyl-radical enzyme activating protein [Candidatus Aminicenantes bacterium]